MTAKNLSVCFSPSCVRKPDIPATQQMSDMQHIQKAFEVMIERYPQVFKNIKAEK